MSSENHNLLDNSTNEFWKSQYKLITSPMSFAIHKTLENYHNMDYRIKFSANYIMPFIQSLALLYRQGFRQY